LTKVDNKSIFGVVMGELFTPEKVATWASQASVCGGRHSKDLIERVRMITNQEEFAPFLRKVIDLIPLKTSMMEFSGVDRDIPREFCQDVLKLALVIVVSTRWGSGLTTRNLDEICIHHCVEGVIDEARLWKMKEGHGITVLLSYLNRIGQIR
jgi:hypothetical protein